MTYEELKTEANKMGYSLVKKKEYVPHKKCKCGGRGGTWYNCADGNTTRFVKCERCDIRTNDYKSEVDAWREWNKMQEEQDEELGIL